MMTLFEDPNLRAGLAALAVLVLPGLIWLAAQRWQAGDWLEGLALAIGLSIALTALAGEGLYFLQAYFPGANPAPLYVILLGVLAAVWGLQAPRLGEVSGRRVLRGVLAGLGGVLLLTALVVWRWYQASPLLLPAWVDSLHHTVIVQLIAQQGGIPNTFAPYFDAPLHYHYGFHYITALFSQMAKESPEQSVLWFGQLLNALIALSVYRLARVLWKPRWVALIAALLVGFAFQMPAYYVSWGRYTLSAGLVLLPLAMAQALIILREPPSLSQGLTLVVLTAGVALTHLTALYLLGLFVGWLLIERAVRGWRLRRQAAAVPERGVGFWLAANALLGVLLALPWLLNMVSSYQRALRVEVISAASDQAGYLEYLLYLLGPRHNEILLGAGLVGLVWALHSSKTRALALWGLLLAVQTLPWGLRLGPFRPDHMAILLFLPAALLLAGGLGDLGEASLRLPRPALRRVAAAAVGLLALGAVGWGAWNTRDVINASTNLVSAADRAALEWVDQNTPAEARFLINSTIWMGTTYRGMDGGYWLETLTGRKTQIPNAQYTLADADTVATINSQNATASQLTTCDAAFWDLVDAADLTHVYLRSGVGSLQPAGLERCSGVEPVYERDGVYIYALTRP